MTDTPAAEARNFIEEIIEADRTAGKHGGRVHTRFPPEPNGYLHIGHAKSICLNFGLAQKFDGKCNLRFDDTNPTKESQEYVDSIMEDVRWLGFQWHELHFASDYFDQLHAWAIDLIKKGKAYVCHLKQDEVGSYRGGWNEAGKDSPYRNRSAEENLELFEKMRQGEFAEGECTLRAKIDMASPNMNLRDPAMYRIKKAHHHRTGDKWVIYPNYDYTHGQNDSSEGITHSICTLEFENHRPLYDWFIDAIGIFHPQQIEFAKLQLTYTVISKRKLLLLVEQKHVDGWNDPRMPTLAGFRRRGYTPEAIRAFCDRIGVSKFNSVIDLSWLEDALREDLNRRAQRRLAVLRPIKVVIENWPEGQVDWLDAVNNPEDPAAGTRSVPFGREIYIERDDFMENPPKQFFRLAPGREVRLRYGYLISCTSVVKDAAGTITELRCTYDPATRGGNTPDGRKVKATLHWVSAQHAVNAEVRLFESLYTVPNPEDVPAGKDFTINLNPNSKVVISPAKLEPNLAAAKVGDLYQFERLGYFVIDAVDSQPDRLVFNRSVTLKDSYAKATQKK